VTESKTGSPIQVTVGAGIAIAGAWLAGAAITITLLLITFVWNNDPKSADKFDAWGFLLLLFIIASPMIAAYSITKVILGKED
jgi:hypothetical protein